MTNEHNKINYRGADYIHCAFNMAMRKVILDKLVQMIRRSGIQFDTIVFRGMSGCLVGPSVSDILNKPFVMVRKPNDGSHSSHTHEGHADMKRYIIVDDLICTGTTVDSITTTFAGSLHNPDAKCVGIFLYNQICAENKYRKVPIYACKSETLANNMIIVTDNTVFIDDKYPPCFRGLIRAENEAASNAREASYKS